jgi:hypothetical protein
MPVGNWAAAELCTDADILALEATWLNWTKDTSKWRASAKSEIERKLRYILRQREIETDEPDVLNLIPNPDVFKAAATFKAIELCCVSNITISGDGWDAKAKHYKKEFDEEFEVATAMMSFDFDESGTIDDTEKYQVDSSVRFSRGGGVLPLAPEDVE